MSITVTGGLPANVVEIGNEVTQGIVDALNNTSPAANSSNVFATASNIPAFATIAQAQNTLSETTVVSPKTVHDAMYYCGSKMQFGWTTATSGTGSASATYGSARTVTSPTTLVGHGTATSSPVVLRRDAKFSNGLDFSKRVVFGGRLHRTNVTTVDENSVMRFSIGKAIGGSVVDLTSSNRGMMVKVQGNANALQFLVANGSNLDTINTTFIPSNNMAYDVLMISDGGVAQLFINDVLSATSSNAPTTAQGDNLGVISMEAANIGVTVNSAQFLCSEVFVNQGL
jgi:hypothetical protein